MSSNAVTVKAKNPVVLAIETRVEKFASYLPRNIPSDKFMNTFWATMARSPELKECDPKSVIDCVTKAAQDGLIIDGREAAIVTFNSRNGRQASYIPMRTGIIKRIRNSGEISTLDQSIVYESEIADGRFEWKAGDDGYIRHEPIFDRDPGKPVLVYSIARLRDGSISRCVMRKDQVLKIKARSRSSGSGPWVTDEEEMWKKTCLRRHSKDLPMDSDLRRIFERDDFDPQKPTLDAEAEVIEPIKPGSRKRAGGAAAALNEAPAHDPETGEIQDVEFSEAQAEPNGDDRDEEAFPGDVI